MSKAKKQPAVYGWESFIDSAPSDPRTPETKQAEQWRASEQAIVPPAASKDRSLGEIAADTALDIGLGGLGQIADMGTTVQRILPSARVINAVRESITGVDGLSESNKAVGQLREFNAGLHSEGQQAQQRDFASREDKSLIGTAKALYDNPAVLSTIMGEQVLPTVATMGVGKGMQLGQKGLSAFGIGSEMAQSGAATTEEVIRQGVDEGRALLAGGQAAVTTGLIGKVLGDGSRLAQTVTGQGGKGFAREAVNFGVREPLSEVAQEVLADNAAQNMALGKDALDNWQESAVLGAAAGMGQSAAMQAGGLAMRKIKTAGQANTIEEAINAPITRAGDLGDVPMGSAFVEGAATESAATPSNALVPYTRQGDYVPGNEDAPIRGREAVQQPLNTDKVWVADENGNVVEMPDAAPRQIADKSGVLYAGTRVGEVTDNQAIAQQGVNAKRQELNIEPSGRISDQQLEAYTAQPSNLPLLEDRSGVLYAAEGGQPTQQIKDAKPNRAAQLKQGYSLDPYKGLSDQQYQQYTSAPSKTPLLQDKSNVLYGNEQGQVSKQLADVTEAIGKETRRRNAALKVMGSISAKEGYNAKRPSEAYKRAEMVMNDATNKLAELNALYSEGGAEGVSSPRMNYKNDRTGEQMGQEREQLQRARQMTQGLKWETVPGEPDRLPSSVSVVSPEARNQMRANVISQKTSKEPDNTRDSVTEFIAKSGGLDPSDAKANDLRVALGVDPNKNQKAAGIRSLFAKKGSGMKLDQASELLWQNGYLQANDSQELLAKLYDGGDFKSNAYNPATEFERKAIEAEADYRAENYGKIISRQEQERLENEIVDEFDQFIPWDVRGFTNPTSFEEWLNEADIEQESPAQGATGSTAARAAQGSDSERVRQAQSPSDRANETSQDFALEGETNAQILAREQQAKQQAQRNAAPAADDFNLTGSNRDADVAAANGAQDLFENSPATPSQYQQESIEQKGSVDNTQVVNDSLTTETQEKPIALKDSQPSSDPLQLDVQRTGLLGVLDAVHKELTDSADDWASRTYKKNKTRVEFQGDGPVNAPDMSISAINESRKNKAIDALMTAAQKTKQLINRIESEGVEKFTGELVDIYQQAGSDANFEAWLLDDLKFKGPGGRGAVASNQLSRALLPLAKEALAKKLSDEAQKARQAEIDKQESERSAAEMQMRIDNGEDAFDVLFGGMYAQDKETSPVEENLPTNEIDTSPERVESAPDNRQVEPEGKLPPPIALDRGAVAAAAKDSHRHTSHSPERRAQQEMDSYVGRLQEIWDKVEPIYRRADAEARERMVNEYIDLVNGYTSKQNAVLYARGQTASTMITGGSKFNVERNNKRLDTERRRVEEAQAYLANGLKRILKAAKGPIDNSPSSALVQAQRNLDARIAKQAAMKQANAEARKEKREAPHPSWELTNNNAQIKRLSDRVAELSDKAEAAAKQQEGNLDEQVIDGIRIVNDEQAQRVQLYFDGKPDAATRETLKSNGFKWAPSIGAWQRQNTANGLFAAQLVIKEITGEDSLRFKQSNDPAKPAKPKKTVEEIKAAILKNNPKAQKLIDSGKIKIVQSRQEIDDPELRSVVGGGTQAFYDTYTNQLYLLADGLKHDPYSVLLHEIGHASKAEGGIFGAQFETLSRILDKASTTKELREAVERRMDKSGVDPDYDPDLYAEERLMYAVEEAAKRNDLGSRGFLRRALDAIRKFYIRAAAKFGLPVNFNEKDLYRLAEMELERMAEDGYQFDDDPNGGGVKESRAPNESGWEAGRDAQEATRLDGVQSVLAQAQELGRKSMALAMKAVPTWHLAQSYKNELPALLDVIRAQTLQGGERSKLQAVGDDRIKEWRNAGKEHGQAQLDKLADLMNSATIWGIDPDKAPLQGWRPEWKNAYKVLRADFEALPKDLQQIYRDVREDYKKTAEEAHKAVLRRIDRDLGKSSAAAALRDKLQQEFDKRSSAGVYFPLGRSGDYVVHASDANGAVVIHAPTQAEAMAQVEYLKRRGYDNASFKAKDKQFKRGEISLDFVRGVADAIDAQAGMPEDARNALLDEVNQLFIQHMPDTSARRNFLHRKGTPGAGRDAIQNYARVIGNSARMIANLNHGDAITAAMSEAKKQAEAAPDETRVQLQDVVQNMQARQEGATAISPLVMKLNSLGFLYAMGLNVSTGAVNLTQVPVLGYPYLAAKYGPVKAAKELLRASGQLLKTARVGKGATFLMDAKRRDLPADELQLLERLEELGQRDLSAAMDLLRAAQVGQIASNSKLSRATDNMMLWSGYFMRASEIANRDAMALANYRLAKAANSKATVEDIADEVVATLKDTMFDYSIENRPNIAQGTIGHAMFLFKNYMFNLIALQGRMMASFVDGKTKEEKKEARNFLAGMVLMQLGMAGMMGAPVALLAATPAAALGARFGGRGGMWAAAGLGVVAITLASAMGGDDDEGYEWDAAVRKAARDLARSMGGGAEFADVLAKGVPTLLGADIAGRISMQDLFYRDSSSPTASNKQKLLEFMFAQTGAVGMFAGKGATALDRAGDGETGAAALALLPSFMANPAKSVKMIGGVKDGKGVQRIGMDGKPVQADFADIVLQAAGFRPADIAREIDFANDDKAKQALLSQRRTKLVNEFVAARNAGGGEKEREAIRTYNSKQSIAADMIDGRDVARASTRSGRMEVYEQRRANRAALRESDQAETAE